MVRRIRELPSYKRPREKMFEKGGQALTNKELIAVILGSGTKQRDVIKISGEVDRYIKENFPDLEIEELIRIPGMGKVKSLQILAGLELARRYLIRGKVKVRSPESVVDQVRDLRNKQQEYFITLTLDGAYNLIEKRVVSIGILNESLVHPREVFADAISDRAAAIILVHNHPSGEVQPSRDDIAVTLRLIEAGDLLGIQVLDHIIIGKEDHYSLKTGGDI